MIAHAIIGQASHVGLVRQHNEDCILCAPERGLFVVADGVGGEAGGEVASRIAVSTVGDRVRDGAGLAEAIMRADRDIAVAAGRHPGYARMGTTVVVLRLREDAFHLAWVGDSRAYRLNQGIEQLSHDHSLVQELVDGGAIDADQAACHPQRHLITRIVGYLDGDAGQVDEVRGAVSPGDVFLLCSDGLSQMVGDAQMLGATRAADSAQSAADTLVQRALDAGGIDNVSVVVVGPL